MENNLYPMPRAFCGAKTRSGGSCKQPSMQNGRCRLHGGKSLSGKAHGRYKHGQFTKIAKEERRRLAVLLQEVKDTMKLCEVYPRITEEVNKCTTIKGHHTLSKIIIQAKDNVL
ncbi:HGGxSTG domain-containing protein [uncultured Desulfobulbus sp.]|uniref:HGGxSTG domain-containing protein n=1 Tax=uncultured Desulfobulbus sp. TaxID=239745 RepID=UPI0029C72AE0|nr:HGGxSTG domain-containing protein [uncultured Desulfobulbus sp.]